MAEGIEIAAALAAADVTCLADEIAAIEFAGIDRIQVDVADGSLTRALGLDPVACRALRPHIQTAFDIHIASVDPGRWLDAVLAAGPDRVILPVEAAIDLVDAIGAIRATGAAAGLSVGAQTDLTRLGEILGSVDQLLVRDATPERLQALCHLTGEGRTGLAADGADGQNARSFADAGADTLIAGAALFATGRAGDTDSAFDALVAVRVAAGLSARPQPRAGNPRAAFGSRGRSAV